MREAVIETQDKRKVLWVHATGYKVSELSYAFRGVVSRCLKKEFRKWNAMLTVTTSMEPTKSAGIVSASVWIECREPFVTETLRKDVGEFLKRWKFAVKFKPPVTK